jgi:hypothetical protein
VANLASPSIYDILVNGLSLSVNGVYWHGIWIFNNRVINHKYMGKRKEWFIGTKYLCRIGRNTRQSSAGAGRNAAEELALHWDLLLKLLPNIIVGGAACPI